MNTKGFWTETIERAVKTSAQTAAALMSGNGLGVTDVDWEQMLSVSLVAFVYSVLTSVGTSSVGPKGTPRVTK